MMSDVMPFAVSWPRARSEFCRLNIDCTSASVSPKLFNLVGFTSTRTEGDDEPPTTTWPTPWIWESFCSITLEASSYILPLSYLSDVRPRIITGASAGFTLR